MKKAISLVLLVNALSSMAFANDSLMSCRDRYFNNFSAKINDGKVSLRFGADGYAERLELADKLGLPSEKQFNQLFISLPEKSCSWASEGRLSCYMNQAILVFKNFQGDMEIMPIDRLKLSTGEMGVGANSFRLVYLVVEADKVVTDSQSYLECRGIMSR